MFSGVTAGQAGARAELVAGFDARGTAWHCRAEHQGGESNHYPGPIPVADVERRLFHWQADSRSVAVEVLADLSSMTHVDEHGDPMWWSLVNDRQAICRSDTPAVIGIFGPGYAMHQYREWLAHHRDRHPRRQPFDQFRRAAA